MRPDKVALKSFTDYAREALPSTAAACPHCGGALTVTVTTTASIRPGRAGGGQERIRWYVPDDGIAQSSASVLGAKLLESLRAHGQAVYLTWDGGKTVRRVGFASAADGERRPTEEREPIILTPEEFARDWRRAGSGAEKKPRTFSAGGAR